MFGTTGLVILQLLGTFIVVFTITIIGANIETSDAPNSTIFVWRMICWFWFGVFAILVGLAYAVAVFGILCTFIRLFRQRVHAQ
jgi:hypothetical protein